MNPKWKAILEIGHVVLGMAVSIVNIFTRKEERVVVIKNDKEQAE